MKKNLILLIALMLIVSSTGCNQNNNDTDEENSTEITSMDTEENTQENEEDFPLADPTDVSARWNETINKVYELGLDSSTYPFCEEIFITASDNSKLIDYTVVVQNDTTEEQAKQYATELIKMFNDNMVGIGESYAPSSDGYYGELFDTYNVSMVMSREEDAMYEANWLVCQNIRAGSHDAIKIGGYVAE